jgi:aryl-alcohol dehydrogenase-like predicted oxidoreductase
MMVTQVPGAATVGGTASYAGKFGDAALGFFREGFNELSLSSIGLGTGGFHATPTLEERHQYEEAVVCALSEGINFIDTASNYGMGSAEDIVGSCLLSLIRDGKADRAGIVICSKGGYWPFGEASFHDRYVRRGLCSDIDLIGGNHCLRCTFLRDQIEQSSARLKLSLIDIYFLHNPEEQLVLGPQHFAQRMRLAFEVLEQAVASGQIGSYGVATAEGFRGTTLGVHRLDRLLSYARDIAGEGHHFKVIQVPLNLRMSEALFTPNHVLDGRPVPLLRAAEAHGITVVTSISANAGRVSWGIPPTLRTACLGVESDVQIALQFARSAPGVCTALVGMRSVEHVRENLKLRRLPAIDLTAPAEEK